jgi:hypothetical protein
MIYQVPSDGRKTLMSVRPSPSKSAGELRLTLAENPDQAILDFMQSTYEAGANLAKWDRENLEIDWSKVK